MKKQCVGVLCFVVVLVACNTGGGKEEPASVAETDSVSYALGMVMADQFKDWGLTFNYDSFTQGFKDYYEGLDTQFSFEEAIAQAETAYMAVYEEQWKQERQRGIAFLAENAKKPGVVTTASGLQYEVITEGSGARPLASDTVRVNYEGTLINGTVFDSSYEYGQPVEFPLSRVIPGWTEGIQLMNEGSTYHLYIPSELAYGEEGASVIPPNSVLIFKVELLAIVKEEE
ncbi:MAG: FKBP-type peptidyl-prolyl cis-trans isomerase [Treponema sp.]|jgi:FKBP-type peptidyl-prolyl cis-trans isomerase|nr:FKBP-type peptidyl-prolyl cis-trans isomerase [Treponema sp.]